MDKGDHEAVVILASILALIVLLTSLGLGLNGFLSCAIGLGAWLVALGALVKLTLHVNKKLKAKD